MNNNNIKKRVFQILMLFMFAGTVIGCKPTEKNYKSAYDAAVNKRQSSDALDADLGIPGGKLQREGDPALRVVNGDSVYFLVGRLKFIDGEEHEKHRFNVAVGAYKMQTNCSAQVSDLFAKGYAAFGASNPGGMFYVIAGSFDTLDEAVSFDKAFQSKESAHIYSGLPQAPVIIESR